MTYFSNFGNPLISAKWLKIQTSNFARRLKVRDTKPKNEKWVKRGRGLDHVNYFLNFGTRNISGMAEDTNLKVGMRIEGDAKIQYEKWVKRSRILGHVTYFSWAPYYLWNG